MITDSGLADAALLAEFGDGAQGRQPGGFLHLRFQGGVDDHVGDLGALTSPSARDSQFMGQSREWRAELP